MEKALLFLLSFAIFHPTNKAVCPQNEFKSSELLTDLEKINTAATLWKESGRTLPIHNSFPSCMSFGRNTSIAIRNFRTALNYNYFQINDQDLVTIANVFTTMKKNGALSCLTQTFFLSTTHFLKLRKKLLLDENNDARPCARLIEGIIGSFCKEFEYLNNADFKYSEKPKAERFQQANDILCFYFLDLLIKTEFIPQAWCDWIIENKDSDTALINDFQPLIQMLEKQRTLTSPVKLPKKSLLGFCADYVHEHNISYKQQ
jgi:hypothetical protein